MGCNAWCARCGVQPVQRNPCDAIDLVPKTLRPSLGAILYVVQALWRSLGVQTAWCNLCCALCGAVYVVQCVSCTLCGAVSVVQVTWCNLCGAIYVVQAS
eukprot:1599685-Pyramimonas_sp.AAC.1